MTHYEESIWLTYRQDSHLTVTATQFYRLSDLQDESDWLIEKIFELSESLWLISD